MAELVYAFDLKSNGETRTGSSPVSATTHLKIAHEKGDIGAITGKSRLGYQYRRLLEAFFC